MAQSEAVAESASLTADVVVFGVLAGQVRALVIRRGWPPFQGCWALPGGYVNAGEETAHAARRELAEETSLVLPEGFLEFVGVYAQPGRDPRGRVVTFAYTTRVQGLPRVIAADDATEARWVPVVELLCAPGVLAFDHQRILADALRVAF